MSSTVRVDEQLKEASNAFDMELYDKGSKVYESEVEIFTPALNRVEHDAQRGCFAGNISALLGPSGSGKTTSIRKFKELSRDYDNTTCDEFTMSDFSTGDFRFDDGITSVGQL